jgi:hypothetical protein
MHGQFLVKTMTSEFCGIQSTRKENKITREKPKNNHSSLSRALKAELSVSSFKNFILSIFIDAQLCMERKKICPQNFHHAHARKNRG